MLRKVAVLTVSALALLLSFTAWPQSYPSRPVRLIVPFGPGAPDSAARIVGQQLSVQLGQPFLIENKPGASGIIGAEIVAKAPPDGHTLLVTSNSFVVNPSIYAKLPFNLSRDFTPVTNIVDQEALVLVVNAALPAKSVQELIALAKAPGNRLSYSSIGAGNTTHLASELFNYRAGTTILHVPYKGGGAAVGAVASGEVQMMIVSATLSMPFIKAGKLRALGYTHKTRGAVLPDVPTMSEAGLAGMDFDGGWYGMFAPAGTPSDIVARLASEVRVALADPQVSERLKALQFRPVADSPADFRRYVDAQVKHYAEIVRLTGIQPM